MFLAVDMIGSSGNQFDGIGNHVPPLVISNKQMNMVGGNAPVQVSRFAADPPPIPFIIYSFNIKTGKLQ